MIGPMIGRMIGKIGILGTLGTAAIAAGTDAAVPAAVARLRRGIAAGLLYGAQLYVSIDGIAVADLAVGESRPGEPMTPDHLLPWLSSTKPATAIAVAQLWEAGALGLDDPVARHVPEFARGGKEAVTLRHLLTHSGGFRTLAIGGPNRTWEENLARICAVPLEAGWVPGERTAYHPASSWYVLGEIVARRSGLPIDRYLRERIFEPLGMESSWVGIPAARYAALRPRLAPVYRTGALAAQTTQAEQTAPAALGARWRRYPWDDAGWASRVSPAENGWGPARELARLYEMLLAHGARGGARLLAPETVAAMTAPQLAAGRFDESLKRVVHWGLGLRVNAPAPGAARLSAAAEFGRHAAAGSYGHGGFRSSLAFADPARRLAVALAVNGLPGGAAHRRLAAEVVEAVYADLGLAPERRRHPGPP
jgi:CubicO group peptidase (beta-lactamase class C family)